MKVKCIKKDIYSECLIVGETYEIDERYEKDIYNNNQYIIHHNKQYLRINVYGLNEYFRPLSEIRKEKIDRLLNEND